MIPEERKYFLLTDVKSDPEYGEFKERIEFVEFLFKTLEIDETNLSNFSNSFEHIMNFIYDHSKEMSFIFYAVELLKFRPNFVFLYNKIQYELFHHSQQIYEEYLQILATRTTHFSTFENFDLAKEKKDLLFQLFTNHNNRLIENFTPSPNSLEYYISIKDFDSFISYISSNPAYNLDSHFPNEFLYTYKLTDDDISLSDLAAAYGSIKCLKYLLMNYKKLDHINKFAVAGGDLQIIKILQQYNVSFDNCFYPSIRYHRYEISDWLLLNYDCEALPFRKYLHNELAFLFAFFNFQDDFDEKDFDMFLIKACLSDSCFCLIYSIEEYLIGYIDDFSLHLLIAIKCGALDIVKYFIEKMHIDVNLIVDSRTLLSTACENNKFYIVKYLCEKGANTEIPNDEGMVPLLYAIKSGFYAIFECLCEHNANINAVTPNGLSALHLAAQNENYDISVYLVKEKHCDPNILSIPQNVTPVDLAAIAKDKDIVEFLCQNGGHLTSFIYAVNSNIEVIDYCLEHHHFDINEKDKDGNTPFLQSVTKGKLKIIKHLISKGADVNAVNSKSQNALHIAASKSNLKVLQFLYETYKFDINSKDSLNRTPLYYAALNSHYKNVKYLCEHGADLYFQTTDERGNPLNLIFITIKEESYDILKYFIKAIKLDLNLQIIDGMTALHYAVRVEYPIPEIVEYLCINGCDKFLDYKTTNNGFTPLHFCATDDKLDITKLLIKRGANIYIENSIGENPLFYAISTDQIETIKFYIEEKHMDINMKNSQGITPLFLATLNINIDIIKYLCEKGADLSIKDPGGHDCLYYAPIFDIVKYFIEDQHFQVNKSEYLENPIVAEYFEKYSK